MIKHFLSNLMYLCFVEILYIKRWQERKCDIQKNWVGSNTFIEFSDEKGLYLQILMNTRNCYINIQNWLHDEQIPKDNIRNGDMPKAAKSFLLDEPICSLGTTNVFWISKDKIHFYKCGLLQNELNFISTFISESNRNITSLFPASIDEALSNYIADCILKREVKIDVLKKDFNISIDKLKIKELDEIGIKVI